MTIYRLWTTVFALSLLVLMASTMVFSDMSAGQQAGVPYMVTVTVYDPDGDTVPGARVTLENLRSDETTSLTTAANGTATLALAFYREGDTVRVSASKDDMVGYAVITIRLKENGEQMQIPHTVNVDISPEEQETETSILLIALILLVVSAVLVFLLPKHLQKMNAVEKGEEKIERPVRKRSR